MAFRIKRLCLSLYVAFLFSFMFMFILSLCLHLLSMLEYDTENMNSDEIFSSLRGVTEAIQSFSYRSQEDLNEPIRRDGKKEDAVSQISNYHCHFKWKHSETQNMH